jgi:Zn-finger nucleic acid-binding protein
MQVYTIKCNKCEGIFLTGKRTQAFQNNIENSVDQNPSNDSELLCSDCNTIMNVTLVDNIEIDICQNV